VKRPLYFVPSEQPDDLRPIVPVMATRHSPSTFCCAAHHHVPPGHNAQGPSWHWEAAPSITDCLPAVVRLLEDPRGLNNNPSE
jgi:hypothetical protein